MKLTSFEINNFKGINQLTVDFPTIGRGSVTTLIGLNESGKTTILEAINYFQHSEDLDEITKQKGEDPEDLIPLSRRANFTDTISICATFKTDVDDLDAIATLLKKDGYRLDDEYKLPALLKITKKFEYQDSKYVQSTTTYETFITVLKGRQKKPRRLVDEDRNLWNSVAELLSSRTPHILYFPTFLFDFPKRIFLNPPEGDEETKRDPADAYYRKIVEDILHATDKTLRLDRHLVKRALSKYSSDKRSLQTVLHKMGNTVTRAVFERWNEIFNRTNPNRNIRIECGVNGDETNPDVYVEFQIGDGNSIYQIAERSLGFRWFFCFLLFTQFRVQADSDRELLFLFDEPASNLHSRAQTQLIKSFQFLVSEGAMIVYSTHSHYMIRPEWLENAYIVDNRGLDYESDDNEFNFAASDTDIRIHKYKTFVSKYPGKQTYFQVVLDALDHIPSRLELAPNSIFVEGKSDYYFLSYFATKLSLGVCNFIPSVNGASGMDLLVSLYQGWGWTFAMILDDDTEGRLAKNKYRKDWFLPDDSVNTLGDLKPEWKNSKIEDLFSEADKKLIQQTYELASTNTSTFKKKLHEHVQSLLISEDYTQFDSDTDANFGDLIRLAAPSLKSAT